MKQPKVVSIIGTKKSGKTSTTEKIIGELTKRGYLVAAIKHIPERKNFTIDTPGKDTYRYVQHGAKTVIAVSTDEIATIERVAAETVPFDKILEKCVGNDIVLVEGLKQTLARKVEVPKIAVTKNEEEAKTAQKIYIPIIAFSGPYDTRKIIATTPYINALEDPKKLADLIEKKVL